MQGQDWLAERFEENRGHLRGVAYRMLGSLTEADDAVQETWLRLSRSPSDQIENLGGWLTTVVSRVCLDMLRAKKARREESMEAGPEPAAARRGSDPEREAALADSVGLALMVLLERLAPAERLTFVLHDMFGVSFEEIGGILGKSTMATRQLASRATLRPPAYGALPRVSACTSPMGVRWKPVRLFWRPGTWHSATRRRNWRAFPSRCAFTARRSGT